MEYCCGRWSLLVGLLEGPYMTVVFSLICSSFFSSYFSNCTASLVIVVWQTKQISEYTL